MFGKVLNAIVFAIPATLMSVITVANILRAGWAWFILPMLAIAAICWWLVYVQLNEED